ncbi:MAG: RluA family pseudouridine synthase [Clostridia bacterium]|nr:RluA family pseudouridine synthase [Clostridia bacterium]
MRKFTINRNDADLRLDKFIKKVLKYAPDSLIYKYLRKKRIKVNGKKEEISYKLQVGDVLEFYVNDELFFDAKENETSFLKIKPDLDIVYEDENILLIHKKVGVVVHTDEKENFNTLISHILSYLYQKGDYKPEEELAFRPALCNRIDRNTGGIVIAAKNAVALRAVNEAIKQNETEKKYLCLVSGFLEKKEATLTAYHYKDEVKKQVFVSDRKKTGYKEMITKYRVLKETNLHGCPVSLIEVHLITGRTHQIRAHFSHIGHPLIGDGKYGKNEINKKFNAKYQYLYAYRFRFTLKNKENPLYYLNGRIFEIDKIPFMEWEHLSKN